MLGVKNNSGYAERHRSYWPSQVTTRQNVLKSI
jgi:hypothetical protein